MYNTEDILVSINCITYNHEKYIAKAIDSFLMQKVNFRYEILIHDDASTDMTAEIIKDYQKKYPDIIKPILQNKNQQSQGIKKISYRYNHTRAKGKYIAICEGDDCWTDPYKLQKQVDYMEKNEKCSLCFHAADIVNVNKGKIDVIKPYNKDCISPTEDIILGDGGFMATSSILYRKCVMDNAPDFYFNAPIGDYPLQIITSIFDYAYYIDEFMSIYRVGVDGSWMTRLMTSEKKNERIIQLKKKIANMLNEFDKYSNKKYSEAVKKKILQDQFEILVINNKVREFVTLNNIKKYKSIKFKQKFKIYIKLNMPNLYNKLGTFKRYIKVKF